MFSKFTEKDNLIKESQQTFKTKSQCFYAHNRSGFARL